MKKYLLSSVLVLILFMTASFGYAYDLGTKDMVIGAGAATVAKPARANVKQITAPGVLNQSDTEYVLMNDVVAGGTAFTIQGSNITLNLNGKKVVYGNANATPAYGVRVDGPQRRNVAILNGTIQQGAGTCTGQSGVGINCNPIYAFETFSLEVAGLDITYRAHDTMGIYLHWGSGANVHNNTVTDQGSGISNRHQGIDAIRVVALAGSKVHHNIIRGARHVGIRLGNNSEVYNNEINLNSNNTNSYGVMAFGINTFSVHHNKIYGVGIHPIGVGAVANAVNGKVYSNYIETQNTRWGAEYGDTGSAGFRTTWGANNLEVMYNTFVVKASQNYNGTGVKSWGRGLWVGLPDAAQKAEFHDNVIIATNNDGVAKAAGIAVVCLNKSPNLIFRNNKVTSNWGNVLLSDSYGHADGYPQFIDNMFVKQDNHAGYRTIRSDYLYYPSTGVFTGNTFQNGASMGSIDLQFNSTSKKEVKASWHVDVKVKNTSGSPLSGATVVVKDNAGAVVYSGLTNSSGSISTDVFQLLDTNVSGGAVVSREIKTSKTPHSIVVTKDGLTSTRTVTITSNQTIDIALGAPAPAPAPTPLPAPTPTPTPAPAPSPTTGITFTDLDPGHWTTAYITTIAGKGITTGCAPDKYCPWNNITRAQMAVMIVRAKFGENFTYTQTPYFSDVPATSFFFKYVQKLRDTGITQSSGTFGANDLLTREAMAAFITAAKYGNAFTYPQTPYFSDVAATSYYFKYVQKLKEAGITKASGTYSPQGNITRSEIAVFLARAFLGMQ